MKTSIIIMAAGKGTRMHSVLPKVLHKICGKPMISYIIQEALAYSDDVHVILGHEAQSIHAFLREHFPSVKEHLQDLIHCAGTGGALMQGVSKKAIAVCYDRVLILNGDMPLIHGGMIEKILGQREDVVIGAMELENPSGYGRIVLKDDCVQSIIEEKDCSQEERKIKTVNAGIYAVNRLLLEEFIPRLNQQNAQKEYYLTDIVQMAVEQGVRIGVAMGDAESLMGVNNKIEQSRAEEILLDRLRKKAMLNGVIMHLPHTIYLEEDVEFVGECEIYEGVRLCGKTKIINSVIFSHSVIESSVIESSDVGPLAHIRPKSQIKNTHIGNFVEVKASSLDGVKAGHLSYLGDCEIHEGSNVGAGVITCNYDGLKKHPTKIGKNVFIGSDCQLIAPLVVESEVLIGAGTTVSKNCTKGDLVLSRTAQKNIPNGYYKFFKKQN